PGLAPILPAASLQVYPGAVDVAGAMSFAITFPPGDDAKTVNPNNLQKATAGLPDKIIYFNCLIPGIPETCANGMQDPGETDVDCGGPQIHSMLQPGNCPARCVNGQQCLCNNDCEMGLCVLNGMTGMRTCVDPTMYDGGTPGGFPM